MGMAPPPEPATVVYAAAAGPSFLVDTGSGHAGDHQYLTSIAASVELSAATALEAQGRWRLGLAGRYQFAWFTAAEPRPRAHIPQLFAYAEYVRPAEGFSHGPRLGLGGLVVIDASEQEVPSERKAYGGLLLDITYVVSISARHGFGVFLGPSLSATRYLAGVQNGSYGFTLWQASMLIGVRAE